MTLPVTRRHFRLAIALLLGCGGKDGGPSEPGTPALAVRLETVGATDTIGARSSSITAFVTRGGAAVAGIAVKFSVLPDPVWPEPPVRLVGVVGDTTVTRTTSAKGAASADVQFGDRAGAYSVVVTVTGAARPDTVRLTVQPGRATSLHIGTPDTLATVNVAYRPALKALDRAGNATAETVTLQTASPCLIDAGTIVRTSVGLCTVDVAVGALTGRLEVTFVPAGRIFGLAERSLISMKLDGSVYRAVRTLRGGQYSGEENHPARGTNGLVAVMDVGTDLKTHIFVMDSTGAGMTQVPLTMPAGAEQNWPVLSPDGQWIYFSNCNYPIGEICRVWRSHPDGSSPSALTSTLTQNGGYRSNRPALTSDGKTLVYGDGLMRLHTLDLATGVDRSLGLTQVTAFAIHPAGTRIAFVDIIDNRLHIMNLDGTGLVDVPSTAGFLDQLEWTADGSWLIAQPWTARPDGISYLIWFALVDPVTGQQIWLRYKQYFWELSADR